MSDKKKEKGTGAFVCGKCGNRFPKAHGLAIHILRTHKKTWGKAAVKAEAKKMAKASAAASVAKPSKERKSVPVWVCPKCARDKFVNGMSYAAHRRYCKGTLPSVSRTVVAPVLPALPQIPGKAIPEPVRTPLAPVSGNGHNQVERLKAVASQKRREAEEIEKLVASFEVNAQKFLT